MIDYHKLLNRPQVEFDLKGVEEFFSGKTVLVTGANGSIGSEICRLLPQYGIKTLVQLFRSEKGMICHQVWRSFDTTVQNFIGDITDSERIDFIFRTTAPNIVFHAAAHKHVPLMEQFPGEAIKNNVFGTQVVVSACERYSAQMVLVSTDKAASPTSVMGATKRLAEMHVQRASNGRDGFCMARLINVIGSSGSVLEIWKRQLDAGQRLTITHPEMTRYFMTVREAALLLLKGASIAKGNERFVFDMNEPTRILDLAERFTRQYLQDWHQLLLPMETGIRPGEKIHEASPVDDAPHIVSPGIRASYLLEQEDFLSRLNRAVNADPETAINTLHYCLPEYQPKAQAATVK